MLDYEHVEEIRNAYRIFVGIPVGKIAWTMEAYMGG
jgi:hypothetical protein